MLALLLMRWLMANGGLAGQLDTQQVVAPGTREDTLLPTGVGVSAEREAPPMKGDFLWVWRRAEELRGRLG
ncbi:hypothetical protein FQN60_017977 [Etheostoma spectabile]|uniref:Uncharacterized protein n=1 Tax=Etheostoma spectabile TaxID=54343 RepID=A0A5J5DGR5_9PERO|nr:hypothetical protein FQN60_017977 [Etheostoma spectabile]